MKTIALINPASGSVSADGEAKIRTVLEELRHGQADVVTLDLNDCRKQMHELAEQKPDILIVWGGDGTLRTALTELGHITPNLLLLPGGTMNLLTKSIHGDKPWDQILRETIIAPRRHRIAAGEANGERFYCAMLAGAPAKLAEAREALRKGNLANVLTEATAALNTLQAIHLTARYSNGYSFGDETLPTTSVIGAMVGPMSRSGGMEIAALTDPTAVAALSMIWSTLLSDWRNAPGVKIAPAETLEIRSEEGEAIPVIVDGEAIDVSDRLKVTYIGEAAECLTAHST